MLTFYCGMIWMAGFGTVHLLTQARNISLSLFAGVCLIASALYLVWQVWMTNTKYPADPTNPYVYAHTSMDIYHMSRRVEEVAEKHPEGRGMYIQVISPDHDYWPLPWYLRKYSNVGWWESVDVETPLAPLIIAPPELEEKLIEKMYRVPEPGKRYLYRPLFEEGTELRAGLRMNGYVRQDIR